MKYPFLGRLEKGFQFPHLYVCVVVVVLLLLVAWRAGRELERETHIKKE
jgi:heme A synthase